MKGILFLLLILYSVPSLAQCDIEDYEIFYCSNISAIDLTLFEPLSEGSYQYFENGIEILEPTNFQTTGETDLNVIFNDTNLNCTTEFEILISYITTPLISMGPIPELDCFCQQYHFYR